MFQVTFSEVRLLVPGTQPIFCTCAVRKIVVDHKVTIIDTASDFSQTTTTATKISNMLEFQTRSLIAGLGRSFSVTHV
jgi:hypothetical protein